MASRTREGDGGACGRITQNENGPLARAVLNFEPGNVAG